MLKPSKKQKDDFNIETISDIYPEYYILRVNKFNDIAKSSLDEWIYFLKNEEIKTAFKAKGLDRAKETLDMLKLGEKERAVYKRREENKMYRESLMYTAKIEGEERGIKKGIEKGKKQEKLNIAKNLLLAKIDIETIIKSTGLSVDEIKKIKI
jgi:predicted transposase/invertase (TIGR01784 family)